MATGKKYYWIKIKESFMTSDKVDFLMSQKNGANYVVLYQMLCLKTINTNGELARELGEVIIPFDENKIQRDCKYFEIDTIRIALELYKKLGMIYVNSENILQIAEFDNMVGSETDYAQQKRIQRSEENKQIVIGDSVDSDVDSSVDIVYIDIRDKILDNRYIDKDIDKDKNKDKLTSFTSLINDYTENLELRKTLKEFKDMRMKMNKGFTINALNLLLNKLSKLADNDNEKIAILNQSIEQTWKNLFPLKRSKELDMRLAGNTNEQETVLTDDDKKRVEDLRQRILEKVSIMKQKER